MPWVPAAVRSVWHGHVLCRCPTPPVVDDAAEEEEAEEDGAPECTPSSTDDEESATVPAALFEVAEDEAEAEDPLALSPEGKRLSEKRRETDSIREFREEAELRCRVCTRRDLPAPEAKAI